MQRILPYTNEEIAERLALRRACNDAVTKARKAAEDQARRDLFVEVRGRTPARFSDDVVKDAVKMLFVFTPSVEFLAAEKALLDDAAEALPPEIKSERWEVGDCGCVVHRVYDLTNPEHSQTYMVERFCPEHSELTLEELHDTHERETQLRNRIHRVLMDQFPETLMEEVDGKQEEVPISFEWVGSGSARALKIVSPRISDLHMSELKRAANDLGGDVVSV